ncbi:MAG: hypothetical protein GY719_29725 [bacterium]|nr:hypothetical protein [bacterium]
MTGPARRVALAAVLVLCALPALAGIPGDQDGDTDVDVDDIAIILADVNTPAGGPMDPKDLDGDGTITSLDAGKAVLLCTRPLCVTGNNAPMAVDDSATVDEGGTVTVLDSTDASVLDNDSDPEMDNLTVTTVPLPTVTNGTLTLAADGTFSYTHDGSETTSDSFVYEVCDDGAPSLCDTATVSIVINPVDDAPLAVDDVATVTEDDPATATDVLLNDTDVDAGPISVASVTQPAGGTVVNNGTDVTYQPNADFCNDGTPTDDFTYTLAPGGSTATVRVTVTCVNDAPTLGGGPLGAAFTEGGGAVAAASTITVTDPDSALLASATVTITNLTDAGEEVLAATASGGIGGGDISYAAPTLTIAPGGGASPADFQAVLQSLTYEHTGADPSESPDRSLSIVVDDGTDPSSAATSTVTVSAVNDPPVIAGGPFAAAFTEDVSGAVAIASTATITDADDANLVSVVVTITNLTDAGEEVLAATASGGIAGGDINYVAPVLTIAPGGGAPLADFQAVLQSVTYNHTGEDPTEAPDRSIQVVANDGTDPSAAATSTVTVTATNDAPALSTPHMAAFTEDLGAVAIAGSITVTDPDSANLTTATVTLTNAQDGAAEQLGATTCGGLTVMGAGTATLNISGAATPATYQTCLQSVTYNNTSQAPTESPDRSITLVVNDGALASNTATSTVTVTGTPDPPMAEDDAYTTVGHTELTAGGATPTSLARVRDADGVLTKGTADSDPIEMGAITVVALQADMTPPLAAASDLGGDVAMDAGGNFTYVPPLGVRNMVDTFTYTIQNTGGGQDTATVSITIVDALVRYVHNDPAGEALNPTDGGGNEGRSADPYDTLAQAGFGAGGSAVDETILVFVGDGGTSGHTAGIELTDGQILRGQPLDTDTIIGNETLMIGGVPIEVVEPTGADHDTKPEIANGGGPGVTVTDRDGVEIRDLDISGSTSGIAISAGTGAMGTFTRVTVAGNDVAGSTGGHGVDVSSSGTANLEVIFDDNVVDSGDDDGTGTAFFGARFAGSSFTGTSGTLTLSSFADNAVGNTATAVETGMSFDTVVFDADTSNGTIFSGGTRDTVMAGALVIGDTGVTRAMSSGLVLADLRGDLDFDSVDVFNSGGKGIVLDNLAQAVGDFLLTIDDGTVNTQNAAALNIDGATVDVTLATVTTSGSLVNEAVSLVNLGGTGTANGIDIQGGTLAGASSTTFAVFGGSADITFSGDITSTDAVLLSVQSTNSGTVLFDGGTLSSSGVGPNDGNGIIIIDTAGDVAIVAATTTLDEVSGSGIRIFEAVTGNVRIDNATITNPTAGPAVNINGDANGSDQITGTIDLNNVDAHKTIASASNTTVIVAGLNTGASVDFDSASSITASGGGGRILVLSNVGGTVDFNGPVTLATGTSDAVSLTSNTGATISFLDDLDIDTTTGSGFVATGGGTINVVSSTSTTTVDVGAAPHAVDLNGVTIGTGDVTFDTINATGTTAEAIDADTVSNAGIFNGGAVTVNGSGAAGIDISGSSAAFNFASATIDATAGAGINLSGANGIVTFTTVDVDNTTGAGIQVTNNSNAVNVNGGTIGASNDPTGNAVDVDGTGGGGGNVTVAAGITKTTAGRVVEVTDRAGGGVTVSGSLACSSGCTGINVASNSGGTTTFSAGTKTINTGTNTAVTLSSNTGHTIDFTGGGLAVTTTTATGFSATGGGTVTVQGSNNTVSSTTGTAVDITDTTIGANDATFRSIDVDAGGTGSSPGIVLDDSGAGDFIVTGDGTTTVGGNASGGTIENITGADAITLDNTDGLVSFQNMIIEDIANANDGADAIQTRRFHDGIHGENVDGGLRLQSVTMRRFSDHAILGALFSDGTSFTTWDGLELRDSVFENANRFHVAARGDDADEGVIRVRGLTGTVVVDNCTVRLGGRGLDFYTPLGAGTLDATIQRNAFTDLYKEFAAGGTRNVGGRGISFEARGSHDMVVRVGDPAQTNPALGNAFTDNFTASVVVLGGSPHSGDIDTVISRNTFTITDHTTAQLPFGNLTFDFPQGGVALVPSGGTYDAIVSHNTFDEVMHAAGGLGQLTLGLNGGDVQAHVHDNTFRLPWDGSVQIRAEGTSSAAVLFEDNTYVDGMVGSATDDVGFATTSPFNPVLVNVLAGGSLDLTMRRETFPAHDTVFTPADRKHSIELEVQADSAANDLDLHLVDNEAPEGYHLKEFAGSFELFMGVSASAVPATIIRDNGNRGGLSVDTTDPPTVVLGGGAISATGTAPTLPVIVIP